MLDLYTRLHSSFSSTTYGAPNAPHVGKTLGLTLPVSQWSTSVTDKNMTYIRETVKPEFEPR